MANAEKKILPSFYGMGAVQKKTNKIYVCDIFINEFIQPSSRQYGRIHYNETVSFFCHTKKKNETDEREPINFSYIAWTMLHFYGHKYSLFVMLKWHRPNGELSFRFLFVANGHCFCHDFTKVYQIITNDCLLYACN